MDKHFTEHKSQRIGRKTQNKEVEELYLLQRVSQRINSILDLDQLLDEIINDVVETFGLPRGAIVLIDDLTNELEIVACHGWSESLCGRKKGTRLKLGIDKGTVCHVAQTGEMYYVPDVNFNPHYVACSSETLSELVIPIKVHGKLIGVFNAQSDIFDGFKHGRIQLLNSLTDSIATAIENARLFKKEKQEKERMSKDLDAASKVQTSLIPREPCEISGFKVDGICSPCSQVGGDWYDYIHLKDGKLAVILADISGKGMEASLLMSSTRSIIRLVSDSYTNPRDVLERVNQILIEDLPPGKFVTMVYSVIDPNTRSVEFANAGHPWPILSNSQGSRFLKTESGMPLGIMKNNYSECTVKLDKLDRMFLYSDGVSEAMNFNMEEFGTSRLEECASDPNVTVEKIFNKVHSYSVNQPYCDDFTLVMIESL
ncbi:MAG: GAF domain-containing SpoIIE family protein phosphatase [Ignavibacteria bacterium]